MRDKRPETPAVQAMSDVCSTAKVKEAESKTARSSTVLCLNCVLDILPPSVSATTVRAAVMSVRPYGRVVLMGGVGMLGGEDLALPYPWIMRNDVTIRGKWMYPPDAVTRMVALVRSGLLRLEQYAVTVFPLAAVNEAVRHAAANGGPFRLTVLRP